jgi:hypothetical protein
MEYVIRYACCLFFVEFSVRHQSHDHFKDGEASDVPEEENNELNSGKALQLFKFSSRSLDTGHLMKFMEIVAARQFSRTMEETGEHSNGKDSDRL